MSDEEICVICGGSGEGIYLRQMPLIKDCTESFENCRACQGTGFETVSALRDLAASERSLEASIVAMGKAIDALNDMFKSDKSSQKGGK